MGILLLCGRTLVTTTLSSTTAARAFSSTPRFIGRSWNKLSVATTIDTRTTTTTAFRGGSQLFSESQSEKPDEESSKDERVPATGWNHNTPSKPDFWQPVNGDRRQVSQQSKEDEGNSSKTARTGWLHNTTPTSKAKAATAAKAKDGDSGGGLAKAQDRLKQAMLQQERNHRIISPAAFHACGSGRQIVVTEHRLSVPLLGPDSKNPRIDLAFTMVEEVKDEATFKWFQSLNGMTPQKRAAAYIEKAALANADDMIIYLQGGPGFGSPVPVVGLAFSGESSWGAKALTKYKRVVLMDQRGTGKSTPVTKQTLEKRFPDLFLLDNKAEPNNASLESLKTSHSGDYEKVQSALQEATNYMAQFRADAIVQDAEYLREALMLPLEPGSNPPGPRPWGAALGQSFGGFCMMSYLSFVEHPPRVCLMTGGIAPMLTPAYEAYSKLWERVRERSLMYYDMYPGDIAVVKKIVRTLMEQPAKLPSGGTLTARRFLQYGMALGGGPSSFASMHNLFSSAFLDSESNDLTRAFVKYFDSAQPFDDYPIYYWLHESIYADGPENSPSNWAADRAYLDKPPEIFDYQVTSKATDDDSIPTLFFGEMVFPWMSQDYAECSGVGCSALATALAQKNDWGPLYDKDHMRKVLDSQSGVSRAAAAVYYGDMYVDFENSMKVASRGGPLEQCKTYVTNEYQHSGLRDDGANIFTKLYEMATGSVRTPS